MAERARIAEGTTVAAQVSVCKKTVRPCVLSHLKACGKTVGQCVAVLWWMWTQYMDAARR